MSEPCNKNLHGRTAQIELPCIIIVLKEATIQFIVHACMYNAQIELPCIIIVYTSLVLRHW